MTFNSTSDGPTLHVLTIIWFAKNRKLSLRYPYMKIQLSHPSRETELKGPKRVKDIFKELQLIPEAYLVIRGQDLMTEDETIRDDEVIEIRPVISGG